MRGRSRQQRYGLPPVGELLIHQTFTDSSSGPALSYVAIEGGRDHHRLLLLLLLLLIYSRGTPCIGQTGCSAFWEVDVCVCVCVSMCDAGGGGAQGTASFQGRDEEGLASAVVSRGQMMGLSEVFDRQNDWYLVKETMSVTQSCLTLQPHGL